MQCPMLRFCWCKLECLCSVALSLSHHCKSSIIVIILYSFFSPKLHALYHANCLTIFQVFAILEYQGILEH